MSKHITHADRDQIQSSLNNRESLGAIARNLGKATSTISREILKRSIWEDTGAFGRVKNRCIHRSGCQKRYLCENQPDCTRRCAACSHCNEHCSDFVEEQCPLLLRPPYVCNGCVHRSRCVLKKRVYHASKADADYRTTLSVSRQGFNLTDEELAEVDNMVSPLLRNGQSFYHIHGIYADRLPCGERTCYRLISAGALTAKPIDLPRMVRMKPRRGQKPQHKVDKKCREGRTMQDWKSFQAEHPGIVPVQMDSVIGRIGGKALLTVMFGASDVQLAILRDHNDAASVTAFFQHLWKILPKSLSDSLFPAIITDNGSEFSDPRAIEFDAEDVRRTYVFYCNPSSPYEKPNCELNHEFIRRILPKGTSFDELTQMDVDWMMSNINSYGREKFGGKSPLDMLTVFYGENMLRLLCQQVVSPEKIVLKPELLSVRNH